MLGCHGGSAAGLSPTSFLVDDTIAIDAGAITTALSLEAQAAIDHVFVSHAHLDHLATLAFLADNVFALRERPIVVRGPAHALEALSAHLFNDVLWPDFTRLGNGRCAPLALEPLAPGDVVRLGELSFRAVPMEHTVPCLGYLVQGPRSALALCSDTVSSAAMAQAAAQATGLAAVVLECSFPERLADVAAASMHLTARGFARERARLPADVPVWVTHPKPGALDEIRAELAALGLPNVELLEQGREYVV